MTGSSGKPGSGLAERARIMGHNERVASDGYYCTVVVDIPSGGN